MTKTLLLLSLLSVGSWAATPPMSEQEARSRFAQIKHSEYRWVLAQWKREMRIKTGSRTSARHTVWGKGPLDVRRHDPIGDQSPYSQYK